MNDIDLARSLCVQADKPRGRKQKLSARFYLKQVVLIGLVVALDDSRFG